MRDTVSAEYGNTTLSMEIENRHRQQDLCTIYSARTDGTWITAREGSFVDPVERV